MRLVGPAFICLIIASLSQFLAGPVQAQANSTAPYDIIAADCGSFPGSPVYAQSEYTNATAMGIIASVRAERAGQMAQAKAIGAALEKMSRCQKQERVKFMVLPLPGCFMLAENIESFRQYVDQYRGGDPIIDDQIKKTKEQLKKQGAECLKELTRKCIDPTDTQAVLEAIRNMRYAVASGGVTRYSSRSGTDFGFWLIENAPFLDHLRFCTETNFDCKGSKEFCDQRRELIERYFLRYGFR